MLNTNDNSHKSNFINSLQSILGKENVFTDEENIRFFSSDVFREAILASLVIRPKSTSQLSEALALASNNSMYVIPRGGGLSYTDGYLPIKDRSMIVDMQGINKIIEINEKDMFVIVESGCTWSELYEALKVKGLRTPYFGPLSGLNSTIGGAMSQNSIFFGSGLYGSAADQCIGLEVVLSDGKIMKTGSWATPYKPSPFFRTYGPDLTGLFLGDTGSLGFKTKIVLKLIPMPKYVEFASFAFNNYKEIVMAMSEISRRGIAAECFSFDPYLQGQRLKRQGLLTDFKRLVNVARSGKSIISGMKDAAAVAASGRSMFEGVSYSMHVVVESRYNEDCKKLLEEVNECCLSFNCKSIEPSLPKIMRSSPFVPPTSMLGAEGERWVPIHAMVPHSRIENLIDQVHNYFEDHKDIMEKNEIEWGYLMATVSHQTFLMEPVFFWKDSRHSYHDKYLGKEYIKTLKNFPENLEARKVVTDLREGLSLLFMKLGSVHFQIGKAYKYKEARDKETWELLKALKKYVDPNGRMNPGSLGFD
ncbi:FAD-binding oxidoreductase [Alphaproteobacteria bacterium]|nr:FAD-binding oxidoreductase [Alphaproteobacteria bacterium]